MESTLTTTKLHLAEILGNAGNLFTTKMSLALFVSGISYLFGSENHSALLALFVLIAFDMSTAILAAYKTGDLIESRKALKTATKTVVYGLFISGGHLTETIVPGTTFLDSTIISFLAITEFISIMENIGRMGYAIPQKVLNRLQEIRNYDPVNNTEK